MDEVKYMDISVGTGIYSALGRQDVKTDQIFREFIDNSTTSYFEHEEILNRIVRENKCVVHITWDDEKITIKDNAFGMNEEEFNRALKLNARAESYSETSRGKYGLGMKYAIASLGNWYKIESTAYGSNKYFKVEMDINELAEKQPNTWPVNISECPKEWHGTLITIRNLTRFLDDKVGIQNKRRKKKTLSKVEDLVKKLATIYKKDIQNGRLEIRVNDYKVDYVEPEFLQKSTGGDYFTTFHSSFSFGGKTYDYDGWIGILKVANVSDAGFTLIQKGRAIQMNYRPEELFGKSNDFRYQRIIGEIELTGDNWVVTFTKEAIKWDDNGLHEAFLDSLSNITDLMKLFDVAKKYRKKKNSLNLDKVKKFNLGDEFKGLKEVKKTQFIEPTIQKPVLNDKDDIDLGLTATNTETIEDAIIIPISFESIDYEFEIVVENEESDNWIKIKNKDSTQNKYYIHINNTVSLLQNYNKNESQKVILTMAICIALAQLSSERIGLKLSDSQKFINQLNIIMNHAKR